MESTDVERGQALVRWGGRFGRRMPWRTAADPYSLAVAEVLLQKTRADAAKPVWALLLDRFPDAASLAEASEADIVAIVGHLGLGTQRSARLQAMARALRDGIEPLPGIGPYGAGVLALARRRRPNAAPVDGNVARVASRLHGLAFERGEPRKKPEVRDSVLALLEAAGEPDAQLRVLYAVVDLGAEVCTPRGPRCSDCPLARSCHFAEASLAA